MVFSSLRMSRRNWVVAVGVIILALVLSMILIVVAPASDATEGTVDRVVDGDTVDIRIGDEVSRVRLLNVDTPELGQGGSESECLADEAREYTESLLRPGTDVQLQFDQERADRYGRTLAHVVLADDTNVSVELARMGFGIPMTVGVNDALISDVETAFEEAHDKKNGFFDESIDCTIPGTLAAIEEAVSDGLATESGSTAADALAAAALIEKAHEQQLELLDTVRNAAETHLRAMRMFSEYGTTAARSSIDKLAKKEREFRELAETREAKVVAEERRAAERAEVQRRADDVEPTSPRPAPRVPATPDPPPLQSPPAPPPPADDGSSGDGGYTGPRCYAPGGKTWRPC